MWKSMPNSVLAGWLLLEGLVSKNPSWSGNQVAPANSRKTVTLRKYLMRLRLGLLATLKFQCTWRHSYRADGNALLTEQGGVCLAS